MKTLFLTIATKNYINYVNILCDSMQEYCKLKNFDILVLTDREFENNFKKFNVLKHKIQHVPHPIGTLLRYHYYLECLDILKQYDYVFHVDSDMKFVDHVGDEILSERVCVIHTGYYDKYQTKFYDLEKNQSSHAYVDVNNHNYSIGRYYQNCFQGGSSSEFIKMCSIISEWCSKDLSKNIIPKWHDESYMNKYMYDNKPTLELSPSYAYPELWSIPFGKKIIHLAKDHERIRYGGDK